MTDPVGTLYDLFFNHEHPHREIATMAAGDDGLDWDSEWSAVEKDAEYFLNVYGGIFTVDVTAEELTRDFMGRR